MKANSYLLDIEAQGAALRSFAASKIDDALVGIDLSCFDRIIYTGMGASHFAAHRSWCKLTTEGFPVWWVSTTQLLALPELVTADSLVWITSQSGESGEVVELLRTWRHGVRPKVVVGITNNSRSPLAAASDVLVLLHCGDEASVSTKSFVTTLAAHERALAAAHGADDGKIVARVLDAASAVDAFSPNLAALAGRAVATPLPRFALIGFAHQASSALAGALILKEAAKVPAEGFVGGEFRHGPLEIAGRGLTAILYGDGRNSAQLNHLDADLLHSGSHVVRLDMVTRRREADFTTGAMTWLSRLVCSAKFSQLLSVEIAKARGIEPGAFAFGAKVTSTM